MTCSVTAAENGRAIGATVGDASSSPREPRLDKASGDDEPFEKLSKKGTKRLFGGGVSWRGGNECSGYVM